MRRLIWGFAVRTYHIVGSHALAQSLSLVKAMYVADNLVIIFLAVTELRSTLSVFQVPECKDYYKRTPTTKMLISENVGILLGYGVMLVLAIYEDRLSI